LSGNAEGPGWVLKFLCTPRALNALRRRPPAERLKNALFILGPFRSSACNPAGRELNRYLSFPRRIRPSIFVLLAPNCVVGCGQNFEVLMDIVVVTRVVYGQPIEPTAAKLIYVQRVF